MSDSLTILLVEDNEPDARYIEELFGEITWPEATIADYRLAPTLVHVETLAACRSRLERSDIDLVLLDLNLPDSSGLETVETVLEVVSDEPVIVLTGLDDERVGVAAVERGTQDYLVKDDVNPTLLGRTIRYAIERQRRNRLLEQRNEELALLNRLVRHDIRDDMALIRGWGMPLCDHVDAEGERNVDRILEASRHVLELTDTVGEFLETLPDREEISLRPVEVAPTLEAELDKSRSLHHEAQIEFVGDISDDLTVEATELLSSIFRNLLANAIQHNDRENPHVEVDVSVAPETVTVSVADNGPGIAESRKAAIFGRTDDGLASPDSGVGLYLVDTLVDLYGGQISVADNDPRGSVFEVRLNRPSENK